MRGQTWLILLSLSPNLLAEVDSTTLSFYPLHQGDYWEYSTVVKEYDGQIVDESYSSLQVTGASLLDNGKSYQTLVRKSIPDTNDVEVFYERIDSSTSNVYRFEHDFAPNYEYLIDSLNIQRGDTSRASRNYFSSSNDYAMTLCTDITDENILGQNTTVKHLSRFDFMPGYSYELAQNFGIVRILKYGEARITETKLLYAIIEGQEYGSQIVASVNTEKAMPNKFELFQNYPNPFNASTQISYSVSAPGIVNLTIYNLYGREIERLVEGFREPGTYTAVFETNDLSSGIYYYRVQFDEKLYLTKKMILLK